MNELFLDTVKTVASWHKRVLTRMEKEQARLVDLPAKTLMYKNNKGKEEYYLGKMVNRVRHRSYIKDAGVIRDYKRRRYLSKAVPMCRDNLFYLESLLEEYQDFTPRVVKKKLGKAYRDLDKVTQDLFYSPEANKWLAEQERIKASYPIYKPEELTETAFDGTPMRSKSESMIYDVLKMLGIPFIYELPMVIGGELCYPDFVMLHETTGSIIILEHLGMMNDFKYRNRNMNKLANYMTNGYTPNENLILTFDNWDGKINAQCVFRLLQPWFMNEAAA